MDFCDHASAGSLECRQGKHNESHRLQNNVESVSNWNAFNGPPRRLRDTTRVVRPLAVSPFA